MMVKVALSRGQLANRCGLRQKLFSQRWAINQYFIY